MISIVVVGILGMILFGDSLLKNERREMKRLKRKLYQMPS